MFNISRAVPRDVTASRNLAGNRSSATPLNSDTGRHKKPHSSAELQQTDPGALPSSENDAASIKSISDNAAKGDAHSQYLMGIYLQYAAPAIKRKEADYLDYLEISRWYDLASSQGHQGAQFELGKLHQKALGVPKDLARSRQLWHLASEAGHVGSMAELGSSYWVDFGPTAPADSGKAVFWSTKAADRGHPQGMNNLAVGYWRGKGGLAKNYKRASELFKAAADLGSCVAMLNTGGMYLNGDGVPQDKQKVQEWFIKSQQCDKDGAFVTAAADHYLRRARTGTVPATGTLSGGDLLLGAAVLAVVVAAASPNSGGGSANATSIPQSGLDPCTSYRTFGLTASQWATASIFSGGRCDPF
jgi:TPR repeat protein